jgi:hypothetical protein
MRWDGMEWDAMGWDGMGTALTTPTTVCFLETLHPDP